MNPEIKAQWVAALRSGEFPRGVGFLAVGGSYCCLGVLCELGNRAGIVEKQLKPDALNLCYVYGEMLEVAYLPEEIRQWAGLTSSDPMVWGHESLSAINDRATFTFADIAKIIEESSI